MSGRRHRKTKESSGFRGDLREALVDLRRHTSPGHRRFVLFLILVGAVLRASLLMRPISYPEAFAFVQFGTQDIGGLVSDYLDPANHIFHTLLTKISTGIFGVGRVALRLPAFMAGVLVLPLFYFFVRSMFNRYIGLLALALAVASGPLIEYSALARGFSISWLCFMLALIFGRHVLRTSNVLSAILLGVVCALGTWSVPSMIYAVLLVHLWMLFSILAKYETTLRQRFGMLFLSLGVFAFLAFVLYLPVITAHGFDQLVDHRTLPQLNWRQFRRLHQEGAFELWAYIVDSSAVWIAILGFAGMIHAAFISSKFRFLAFALLFGAAPLVMMRRYVAPPEHWLFAMFIFHLSSAIALYYLLKFVQEKLFPAFSKRWRTVSTAFVLLLMLGWPGMRMAMERTAGMPEAAWCVRYAKAQLAPGDKLYAGYPWVAPIAFSLLEQGMDRSVQSGKPPTGGGALVAVAEADEQTLESVLIENYQDTAAWFPFIMVQDRPGMKIFAARMRGEVADRTDR